MLKNYLCNGTHLGSPYLGGMVENLPFPNTKIVKISEICKRISKLWDGRSNSGQIRWGIVRPLGKRIIMSVSLAVLGLLGSAAATGIGAAGSAMANESARNRLLNEQDFERARLNRLLARNFVDSPENAGLLRRVQDLERDRYNRARATNVVAGGTDAHLASMQAQGNDVVTRTANGVAERAQAYKDRVEDAKVASERNFANRMFALDQQKAQTIANAAGQATKAMAGIAAAGVGEDNPFDLFGLRQRDYERAARGNIDAVTEASVGQQVDDALADALAQVPEYGPLDTTLKVKPYKR